MQNEYPNIENNRARIKKLVVYISLCLFGCLLFYYSIESAKMKIVKKNEHTRRFLTSQFKKNTIINNVTSKNESNLIIQHNNYTQQVKKFYIASSRNQYKGTWKSNVILQNMEKKHGLVTLEMTYSESNQTSNKVDINHFLFTYLQLLDGETVDKWVEIRLHGILQMNGTNIDFNNKIVNGTDYFTSITTGEVLDRKNQFFCNSNLFFSYKTNGTSEDGGLVESINGILKSDNCNFEVYFEVSLINDEVEEAKIMKYFVLVIITGILQIISSMWLINRINKYQSNSNYISIITISQSIIWNSYNCLCHFFMSISFESYTSYFGIPAFLFFINFSCFEIRLLFLVWKSQTQNNIQDTYSLRRKLMKFYILFYISIFISLFLVTKLYFIRHYIITAISLTWIPQILYNIQTNNKTSFPLFNVFIISLNKIVFPAYFRGYKDNFLQLSQDFPLIAICVGILLAEIIFMYLQNIFGARFFLPKSFSEKQSYNYYLKKKELQRQINEIDKADCVICLSPLIMRDIDIALNNKSDVIIKNINISQTGEPNPIQICELNIRDRFKKAKTIISNCSYCIYNYLFNFHCITPIKRKGKFMLTPCKHVFHSECLENWILHKSECPTCRTVIPSLQE